MFDETYIHTAENRTDVTRVILFCDVERPLSNPLVRGLNRTIGRRMIKAAATQNLPGEHKGVEQVGLLPAQVAADRRGAIRDPGVKPASRPARCSSDI